ncbi:MAG TPA: hypothetical protein PLF30_01625 [Candidatus Moranbacteria bacterium]|jgi:hypothetical protein|nr:hypothetical protein [Candidatus Moranbacteria bacterium]HPX94235.1 hypothetical protein [Candidatus Moranbacteria bacterium]HQB59676.1 hypothetical protein [Candidatus Moranbacteria bacterium]
MHQTFYIDIDEEISSVIDKLKKSMAGENYFVVPKRALFLQSIVNLKLLKREADKIGKRVTIVTQDNIGISMAERAGIDTRSSIEGFEQDVNPGGVSYEESEYVEDEGTEGGVADDETFFSSEGVNKSSRLNSVGTEDYYDESTAKPSSIYDKKPPVKIESSRPETPTRRLFGINKYSSAAPGNTNQQSRARQVMDARRSSYAGSRMKASSEISRRKTQSKKQLDPYKEKALEKIFLKTRENDQPKQTVNEEKRGLVWKFSITFCVICALSLAGVLAYLFIPSAKIIITPDNIENRININISGSESPGAESKIPIRVISNEESVSLEVEMQGKNVTGKKAEGSVTIYNEFSNAPQPLVATTRLETSDGKIFRIVKGVTVPGTTLVDGEIKPGAIEVQVVADQPGSDFNIDPSEFTIPGFKDSPKYEKFYAKSTEAMTGGTSDENASGPAKVTQADIDKAKEKVKKALEEKIAETIANELSEDEISLEDAREIEAAKISISARVGQVLSSFNCSGTAAFKAIVFSESDIKKAIEKSVKGKDDSEYEWKAAKIEYATVQPDFEKNILELKIHGEVAATPVIDAEKIKHEILGKRAEQLGDILRKYSSIKNVNVEFQPVFISRVPQYSKRVNVEIVPVD